MSDDHWGQPLHSTWSAQPQRPRSDRRWSESRSEGESYWQGVYVEPDYAQQHDEHNGYGSMSAAARRSYANEAIRQKDHVSAGLFAVFLGLFGIHKFYLGYNQAGFIMLAVSIIGGITTFGLAAAVIWIIAIIEGMTYLTKSQTEFDRIYVLDQRDWF